MFSDGVRIWNDQLLGFACSRGADGRLAGDPKSLAFSEMLRDRFGWKPRDGARFDYLPLVVEAGGAPELFSMPSSAAAPVRLRHPKHDWLARLDLRWYPVPAVSSFEASVGGIRIVAAPFNGWYAVTEVVRDLGDENR